MKILGISGSLRVTSSNNAILNFVAKLFPKSVEFNIYKGLKNIPAFDDSDEPSNEVIEFRNMIREANGVIICQPEYAFGVAGSLKNALDWTVLSGELVGKPVALITAATGGDKAHAALLLTLKALSSKVVDAATLLIPFVRTKLNDKGEVTSHEIIKALSGVVNALVQTVEEEKREQTS